MITPEVRVRDASCDNYMHRKEENPTLMWLNGPNALNPPAPKFLFGPAYVEDGLCT